MGCIMKRQVYMTELCGGVHCVYVSVAVGQQQRLPPGLPFLLFRLADVFEFERSVAQTVIVESPMKECRVRPLVKGIQLHHHHLPASTIHWN